jgi:hypothetical protein
MYFEKDGHKSKFAVAKPVVEMTDANENALCRKVSPKV